MNIFLYVSGLYRIIPIFLPSPPFSFLLTLMPFLRKITGTHHNHSRSNSGSSSLSQIQSSEISHIASKNNDSIMFNSNNYTNSKKINNHKESDITMDHSGRTTTSNNDNKNQEITTSISNNSLPVRKKKPPPPPISLEHHHHHHQTRNITKNSYTSNSSGLSNLTENKSNTFYSDLITPSSSSNLQSINIPAFPKINNTSVPNTNNDPLSSKRFSASDSSTLSDTLTPLTSDDNHKSINISPATSLYHNPLTISRSENTEGTVGSTISNSNPNSRKSSDGNSVNSLSFDKLILSWDPTDPEEWTMQRVLLWLKSHEFPDQWAAFFKKNQLYGNNFIRLLAYDNFQVYERHLTISKMGSFTRFQDLLKKTMTKNVDNIHNMRQKNLDKNLIGHRSLYSNLRASSDSLGKNAQNYTRSSITENGLTPTKSGPSRSHASTDYKSKSVPKKYHQKTLSASALYRRSLISLRGSSTSSGASASSSSISTHTNYHNNTSSKSPTRGNKIKLHIPQRPMSTLEANANSLATNNSIITPSKSNLSPLSPGIFRKHHKSSSSESSLLNSIFGSSSNTPTKHITNNNTQSNHSKHHSNPENERTPTQKSNITSNHNSTQNNFHHHSSHIASYQPPNSLHKYPDQKKRHSISNDNLINIKSQFNTSTGLNNGDTILYNLRPVKNEEKETLWDKLKRRSQLGLSYSTSTANTPTTANTLLPSTLSLSNNNKSNTSLVTLTTNNIESGNSNVTSKATSRVSSNIDATSKKTNLEKLKDSNSFVQKREDLEKISKKVKAKSNSIEDTRDPFQDYYPIVNNSYPNNSKDIFIWISKNNISFIPLNVTNIKDMNQFKTTIQNKLSIPVEHDIIVHMTDFYNNLGPPIPDKVLESINMDDFKQSTMKFYIKEQIKITSKSRPVPASNEPHQQLRSVRSRNSVRSVASSIVTDDVSIVTSSSDATSFDDPLGGTGRRYPQTPSIYYDATTSNRNTEEELNYWNIKDQLPPENIQKQLLQNATAVSNGKIDSTIHKSKNTTPRKNSKSSFHVPMKNDTNEIDFIKRRESPYVISELAPRREAPKAPINISPPRTLSHYKSAPHLRRTTTKIHRKPISPSSGKLVGSFMPGSTQVMVPQPYKGATELERKTKSEDDDVVLNTVSNFMLKQRVGRSNSHSSTNHSLINNTPPFLKRGVSKRIISSVSAADVFEENDITFADAPTLSDTDSDDTSSDDIIWSNNKKQSHDVTSATKAIEPNTDIKDTKPLILPAISKKEGNFSSADNNLERNNGLSRKMTLRPSPEEVYENLEKFFPHAYLDKPIVENLVTPSSPNPNSQYSSMSSTQKNADDAVISVDASCNNHFPRRTRTIRAIANEANQARKNSLKLKRHNTKMWGTRMVEITEKQLVAINKSKNSKGEYREFAWMKGEMIGKGSFGAVYLCLNLTTGEMMAVKQVEVPKYSSHDQNIIDMVEALKSEVNTLKDLDHLNIVQYLGFEERNHIYSLFLEYVAGGSVGSLIRLYGRFDECLIRHLTVQVLRGLAYLHSRGILHRDMKADNLLLDQDGICKISDFGISRRSKDIYSNSDMTMRGTVFWMAPEMVDTKQGYSAKVDIWSLGCVVLEMFAGKRPWSNLEVVAAMFKIGKSKSAPPIPEDTLPLISQEGRNFLDSCFEINPDLRPTADKLLSHPFSKVYESFDFKETKLAKFIKSNDILNSSKLRVTSQEGLKKDT